MRFGPQAKHWGRRKDAKVKPAWTAGQRTAGQRTTGSSPLGPSHDQLSPTLRMSSIGFTTSSISTPRPYYLSTLPILYPYYHAPDTVCSQTLNQGVRLVYYNTFQQIYFPLSGSSTTAPAGV